MRALASTCSHWELVTEAFALGFKDRKWLKWAKDKPVWYAKQVGQCLVSHARYSGQPYVDRHKS